MARAMWSVSRQLCCTGMTRVGCLLEGNHAEHLLRSSCLNGALSRCFQLGYPLVLSWLATVRLLHPLQVWSWKKVKFWYYLCFAGPLMLQWLCCLLFYAFQYLLCCSIFAAYFVMLFYTFQDLSLIIVYCLHPMVLEVVDFCWFLYSQDLLPLAMILYATNRFAYIKLNLNTVSFCFHFTATM